jgi:hypothetical protein
MKICKLEHCGAKMHAKGYCNKHYVSFKRYGESLKKKDKKCNVDKCNNLYYGKGYCFKHYQRVKRTGYPELFNKNPYRKEKESEYNSWSSMKKRCFNINNPDYKYYGGRGITVCDEWKKSFKSFFEYIGEKPKDGKRYSIDRIDVNGNYEPGNVRWADGVTQARNRRPRYNKTGYQGVRKILRTGKFQAVLVKTPNGKAESLGIFNTAKQASKEYEKQKNIYWK